MLETVKYLVKGHQGVGLFPSQQCVSNASFSICPTTKHLFTLSLFPAWISATSYCLTFYLLPPTPTLVPDNSGCHFSVQPGRAFQFLQHLPSLFRGLEIFFHCLACHSTFPIFHSFQTLDFACFLPKISC